MELQREHLPPGATGGALRVMARREDTGTASGGNAGDGVGGLEITLLHSQADNESPIGSKSCTFSVSNLEG